MLYPRRHAIQYKLADEIAQHVAAYIAKTVDEYQTGASLAGRVIDIGERRGGQIANDLWKVHLARAIIAARHKRGGDGVERSRPGAAFPHDKVARIGMKDRR